MRRKEGKIIKEVTYRSVSGGEIKVPLRMVERNRRLTTKPGEMKFIVDMDEPIRICVENSDSNIVLQTAFKMLEDHFEIKWDDFIKVEVRSNGDSIYSYGDDEEDEKCHHLEISYKFVQIGKNAKNEFFHRDLKSARTNIGDPREGDDARENYRTESYIPDTPENRAAIKSIIKAMKALGARIQKLMSQDMIQKTLSSSVNFLGYEEAASKK
jgi:hypothetical protein